MIASVFDRLSAWQRSVISAVAALIGYGLWAYLVNLMHGSSAALKAACVQGGYSFLLTFVMTILIELIYVGISRLIQSETSRKLLTTVFTCVIIFSASWWVNAMAGTPEIFNTVILGYVIGGLFTAAYVIGLSGEKSRKQT